MVYLEILLVLGLVVLNGVLAMSELAVVSSRPGRLKAMRDRGVPGARMALALTGNPGRFLSTVQIGITLVGILAGAFSGASLGGRLADWLIAVGMERGWARPIHAPCQPRSANPPDGRPATRRKTHQPEYRPA